MMVQMNYLDDGHYYTCPSNIINDHRCFGGIIYEKDFGGLAKNTNHYSSPIAERIMADWRFDQHCKKNAEQRDLLSRKDDHDCSEK